MASIDFKAPPPDLEKPAPPAPQSPHSPSSPSPTSAIWQSALQKYYDELARGGMKATAIDKDLWSMRDPEDLLAQINTLRPLPGKVAAVLWGSIRLIIKFAHPVLPDLIQMLETLQSALPRMKQYEQDLPMTESLEKALVDLYSEVIVFCAHAITFFRNTPNIKQNRHAWSQFSRDFARIIENVQRLSRRVDEAADMIRLSKEVHTAETVSALEIMQLSGSDSVVGAKYKSAKLPCFSLPYGINLRFFERNNELLLLAQTLDPPQDDRDASSNRRLRAIGIHGLGGVGKSQLALQYANTSMDKYAVIAWLPAASEIKLTQSLSRLATQLGLVKDTNASQDDAQSVHAVRDWLNTSRQTFLLIFDNVDDASLLDAVWPSSDRGSIIITTRSPGVAAQRSLTTLPLRCFSDDAGKNFLQALVGTAPANADRLTGEEEYPDDPEESAALDTICQLIGGLPLAMVQIGDFIRNRACSYTEFLRLYEKSAEKVLKKSNKPVEYEHTVLTTWEISLHGLSDDGRCLQNLLSFLDPDRIPESVLTNAKAVEQLEAPNFEFLADSFDFGDAVMELSRTSMVSRMARAKALSMNRMAQLAVFLRIETAERTTYFDTAVRLLYFGFPNTWKAGGSHQGHGWEAWETCSAVLPHVSWLMQLAQKHSISSSVPELWAELIFCSGTYLWEKEQPYLAESFFQAGLKIIGDVVNEDTAQAHRLLGHIYLDVARPRAALVAYQRALDMQEVLHPPYPGSDVGTPAMAAVYDSIACSLTETGDVDAAFEYLARATAIHEAHDPTRMSRTLAIRAMTCLRADRATEALEALQACWRLQSMDQQQIATSRYPKHSGDIMLLARIMWQIRGTKEGQNDKDTRSEARELVARTLAMRRGVFGQTYTGPRVADSLFTLARMLQDESQPVLAAQLLREIVVMAGGEPDSSNNNNNSGIEKRVPPALMRSHLARAYWFLANVDASLNKDLAEVTNLRIKAREARDLIICREGSDNDDDESYMRLVGWMLW
ncbi:tpr repeat-containing protein [Niveomyces insectorum RCEF 264]|uniref:Tpr repeat-containing protein n=1 Tax=Niveomyces insectorum RCEF 264 TaxID=1081102 RepID=A0A167T9N9_9HYPO|nr:tpr repeat-containing protein [Niveomyces insectorum RCEF 264]